MPTNMLQKILRDFNVIKINSPSFSLTTLQLETLADLGVDLIVLYQDKQMKLTVLEYYLFLEEEIDTINGKVTFEFKEDNVEWLDLYTIKLLSRFHHSWFNKKPLRDYLLSDKFQNLLKEIAGDRIRFTVLPEQTEVFKEFLLPYNYNIVIKPLTSCKEKPPDLLWAEFNSIINQICNA